MNRETNPFGDEYMNPFANASGTDSKSRLPVIASKPLSFSRKNDATIDIPLNSINDAKKKEKEIAEREAELRRREQDIKRREDALTRAGIPTEDKNWPPFFPIIHHDIPKDIPLHAQKLQYLAFASWLGIIACLVWNFLAVFFCSVRGGGIKIFFLATIYAMLGCPLSFVLWYRPLYNAMRTDSALNFGWFFLSYMLHVCFCVLAAIAPPIIFEGMSLVGILAAFDAFTDHVMVGILYLIGCIFFCVESLLSILVLQLVLFMEAPVPLWIFSCTLIH